VNRRFPNLLDWLAASKHYVVCLQETKAAIGQVPQHICDVAGYHCHWHGHAGYSGVALLLRKKMFGEEPPKWV